MELTTLGSGCFWCTEAVYQQLKGVETVVSGYSGGLVDNPSYEQVTTGRTGHAEVCQIRFDPEQISYADMLEVFFSTHDPTTLNRQGNDVGTQYRSVIFYHSEEQREIAEQVKRELDESGTWKNPLVTEIVPYEKFYKAEDYHQNYYRNNPNQGYCQIVIAPKLKKFEKVFKLKLSGL
ncbi:MAG: peptide-methionine (S)-S-oxide reductase MsrA [Candidatus Thorarchaeota archaeon]|jgi:peptide-methionine (S)-S-oxide reductase